MAVVAGIAGRAKPNTITQMAAARALNRVVWDVFMRIRVATGQGFASLDNTFFGFYGAKHEKKPNPARSLRLPCAGFGPQKVSADHLTPKSPVGGISGFWGLLGWPQSSLVQRYARP
mgnify:FL=1